MVDGMMLLLATVIASALVLGLWAVTHTLTLTYTRSGEQISRNVAISADGEPNVDFTLTSSQSNKQVLIAIDVSALKSIYIDSTTDITIKTNSSSEEDDTISVSGGEPLVWFTGCGLATPFTSGTDVTQIYVTNGEASAGTVKIRCLHDATP